MKIPKHLKKVREVTLTPQELIDFETRVKETYEAGKISGPIHLAKNNEKELIEIFQYISEDDWVFVPWRNHYHALLHGVDKDKLFSSIIEGRSMGTNNVSPNFYASSIVGGIIPLALGVALALKTKGSNRRVWCFVGDMTSETGSFNECYKYVVNHDLPVKFIIEDNDKSVCTDTKKIWNTVQLTYEGLYNKHLYYYKYETKWPHAGAGKRVQF